MKMRTFIDSFSGMVVDLKRGHRDNKSILKCLSEYPRISTFDLSEHRWLCNSVMELKKLGYIAEDKTEEYPWHRYILTDTGKKFMIEDAGNEKV